MKILASQFDQRPIGPTHGSFSGRANLATPSGSQSYESALEGELIEQIAFCPALKDLITQPVIRYTRNGVERRYTPDVLADFGGRQPRRFVIEVKREEELHAADSRLAEKLEIGRIWCARNGARFRIMTERDIRTPLLANARLLAPQMRRAVDPGVFAIVSQAIAAGALTISQCIVRLAENGLPAPKAKAELEIMIAQRLVACDLESPVTEASLICRRRAGETDPALRKILRAAK